MQVFMEHLQNQYRSGKIGFQERQKQKHLIDERNRKLPYIGDRRQVSFRQDSSWRLR